MPTYEYVCKKCGETIEIFQSFSDKPLKRHKVCGGDLKKVFHARGIVFKGDGFYATDSKTASSSKSSVDSTSDKGDKKSDAKSDKRPAAKATASSASSDD
ncbi:MAG TPA: FmdB family zinc ribbon protein [Acidimicrobiia bacterium]|jgi:putative FmdB family regulatory protein|nr:FmdB family zinc ribbon protein [Acidimicrobiia bacterium]